ncbi:MAG: 50S ribosomal protein L18 [archaeon]
MRSRLTVQYRRKREGRTNYKKRLIYLKSKTPRLVVRRTNKQLLLQIVEYLPDGDKIICGVNSSSLKKLGWQYSCNNMPACYLAGLLLGKKAKAKHVKEAILDAGLQTHVPGSRIYAAVKGAVDSGIMIPVSPEVFPSKERLSGVHIASYYSSNKSSSQFSAYKAKKLDAAKMNKDFEDFKNKIASD